MAMMGPRDSSTMIHVVLSIEAFSLRKLCISANSTHEPSSGKNFVYKNVSRERMDNDKKN